MRHQYSYSVLLVYFADMLFNLSTKLILFRQQQVPNSIKPSQIVSHMVPRRIAQTAYCQMEGDRFMETVFTGKLKVICLLDYCRLVSSKSSYTTVCNLSCVYILIDSHSFTSHVISINVFTKYYRVMDITTCILQKIPLFINSGQILVSRRATVNTQQDSWLLLSHLDMTGK